MVPVLTSVEMGAADRRTIQEIGLPGAVLMENAGAAVAEAVRRRYGHSRKLVVLCGKGNNGGDGFVVARRLQDLGAVAYLVGARGDVRGDALIHMGAYERSGGRLVEVVDGTAWQSVRRDVVTADVVVDALLGTGLRQEPSGLVGQIVREMEAARRAGGVAVVAVDVPSGVSSDTGEVPWEALGADLTVTFAAPKYGHVLPPACDKIGELLVADIGIPRAAVEASGPRLFLTEPADALRAFPGRAPAAHKGAFGHVLLVAGSVGKTGAAILSGLGALRTGAGLVTVATAAPAQATVAAGRPELMTEPLPVGADGRLSGDAVSRAIALARACDAVVLGPGLGQDGATRDFVREFVRRVTGPLLVDADGLNALSASPRVPSAVDLLRREGPTVVTPHPGEMARLDGVTTPEVQRRRLETARAFAVATGAHVVLKGHRTLTADATGRAAVNATGNPGMATGGTGDVLAGIIGALLARGVDAWVASTAGVFLHGLAGDVAVERMGPDALVAGDLIDALPAALERLGGRPSSNA